MLFYFLIFANILKKKLKIPYFKENVALVRQEEACRRLYSSLFINHVSCQNYIYI